MGVISKTGGLVISDAGIRCKTTRLSATQLKALYTTPQSVVNAPGAGKVVSLLEVIVRYNFVTTAFTGSNALEFRYATAGGAKVSADINASFLLSAANAYRKTSTVIVDTDLTPYMNQPIKIAVTTANPAQGLGNVVIKAYYRTIRP